MTDILKDPALDFNGFFNQMRQALQSAQDKGKSGWDTCPTVNLFKGLRSSLISGNFVDAANYCLFLQRRSEEGFNFFELDEMVERQRLVAAKDDTIRLANITISQHEETIRALREGDKYTGEDISRIIAEAQQDGYDKAQRDFNNCPDPMQGRRNDELLKEACGHGMSLSMVGEVAELVSPAKGYITVTRVGNEVTTTAEVDGTPDMVGAVMVQIAEALGNNYPAHNVDVTIDGPADHETLQKLMSDPLDKVRNRGR